jgi:adenylate kinase
VCHISTGDMLRQIKPSDLPRRVRKAMAQGKLLPDRMVIHLVQKRLWRDKACRRHGWLLDGFPRTAAQAHAMLDAGLVPHHIVVLNASSATLLERVTERAREAVQRDEKPRSDDNAEALRQRILEYERNRDATLAALRRYLRVATIDGSASKDGVAGAIREALHADERDIAAEGHANGSRTDTHMGTAPSRSGSRSASPSEAANDADEDTTADVPDRR